LKKEPTVH